MSKKSTLPKIETSESLTFFLDNKSHTVRKDVKNYADIAKLVEDENLDQLRFIFSTEDSVEAYTNGEVSIKDNVVFYKGKELHNAAARRIIDLMRAGKKFDYMKKFLENLLQNPSQTAIDELYLFLESGNIPITPDGHFLAYRKVDNQYLSYHRNRDGSRNSNKPGETVEMKREDVDPTRSNTCSHGLHFCSFSYLNAYHGGQGRVVIVKINPANVVSIPSDYRNAKGRTWKYEVIAEHHEKENKEAFKDVTLVNSDGSTHEGVDVDIQLSKTFKKKKKKSQPTTLSKRVRTYMENRRKAGKRSPTLRQIQSSLSPNVPDLKGLLTLVKKMKYDVVQANTLGASVVFLS